MRLIHYYGTTAERMGLSDENFAEFNSLPTHGWNECIRRLQQEHDVDCKINLFTKSKKPKCLEYSGLLWVFHPLSLRFLQTSKLQIATNFSLHFLREIKKYPPNLFVFYNIGSFFSFFVAKWLKKNRIPFISMLHTQDILKNVFTNSIFNSSSIIIVPTARAKEYMGRVFGIEESDIVTIPSGINTVYFYPKEKHTTNSQFPVLSFVGRLERNKGFLEALECFIQVKKCFPKAILEVAGRFITSNYKLQVYNLIEHYNVRNNVVFYDYILPINMGDFYRNTHLLLFPSKKEGFGRALVESMMCGTPAVALTGSGGPGEIITNDIDGILTTPANFTQEVLNLLKDPDKLNMLSINAAINTKKKYSLDIMYQRVKTLYGNYLDRDEHEQKKWR